MKKNPLQIAIPVLMLCLFSYNITLASYSAKEIKIPIQFGSIKENFRALAQTPSAECEIIHVQDAHCNYEAQKNMAQLLEYLVKEHNLKLIMVEGGNGNVGLSFLRSYSDKKARLEIADKYLKAGKISGEEYLDIASDYPIELYGIEDTALYNSHLEAFKQVDSFREKGLMDLEGLSNIVKKLESFIYSEEFRQLAEKKSQYDEKAVSLVEYCQYLKELAQNKRINLKDSLNFNAFSEVSRLEKEISFQQAESERNAFIKDLANLLDEKGVQDLINKTQDFKAKKITPESYYSFLRAAAGGRLNLKLNYPQLNAYINYVIISKDVNAALLLKEVNAIEERIEGACLSNTDQKKLNEISKSLQILTKTLNLELTPEDYAHFKANEPQLITASWVGFLNENCNKYNLGLKLDASAVVDDNLPQLDNFYQLGLAREKAFIKNMTDKINESGEKTVVLITGGFHTPGITRMLKDEGYSYMVVTPAITKKGDSSIYFSVLRGEKGQLDKALNGQE